MGRTRKERNNLGSALVAKKNTTSSKSSNKRVISSVSEQSNYDEVIDKLNYVTMVLPEDEGGGEASIVVRNKDDVGPLMRAERVLAEKESKDKQRFMVIPRRPQWSPDMTAVELDLLESQAFSEWKYKIAQAVQSLSHCVVTPFERNLDLWRQLWRVMERSDIIVQIVDARNPLLFFTEDLFSYCKEYIGTEKKFVLLLNKADFLSATQRSQWAHYFKTNKIDFIFYSALRVCSGEEKESDDVEYPVKTRDELLETLKSIPLVKTINSEFRTVGFIGYPNVGKSTTINSLVGANKTSTSSTPGKTKHFQTLFVEPALCLCDCPGLVMPNFVNSKAELLTNGILPVDNFTEWLEPIEVIGSSYGWPQLSGHYNLSKVHRTAFDFLGEYARSRGFVTAGGGNPDIAKSARVILKDFVNGKLVFCHPPPDMKSDRAEKEETPVTPASNAEDKVDREFFQTGPGGAAHVKGLALGKQRNSAKPWREDYAGKRNRKEKLRKRFAHLDA